MRIMKISDRKFSIACAVLSVTKSAVVEKAGISCRVLSNIKAGKNLNALTVGKLANALGIPVENLLEDE